MDKKNNLVVVVAFMFGIVCILCAFVVYKYQKLDTQKNDLESSLNQYKEENDSLKKDAENSNDKFDKLNNLLDEKCEYTQTFLYLGDYKYTRAVPTHKFIVVNKFQEFSPMILEIDTEEFDINFKQNHNYEITFIGGISDDRLRKPTIKEIKETDKEGLNQIQESCNILRKFNNEQNTVSN